MRATPASILALALGLVAPGAWAQTTTGTLIGHVFDQAGTPIRGVRVVASSETQIGGPKEVYTDDEGAFRIVALSPGRFTLTASAPKLKSLIQNNVRIVAGHTTELDLILEIETAEEQVRVVEKAPLIDTNRTTVGETFDQDFLNELPLSTRDYQGVFALTPGVQDVAGDGNPQVRGGSYFNNNYTVDGFTTTDPVTHTFGQNFSFDAQQQVEVQTASLGAENSDTLGGVVNIITRSGSNRFEADTTLVYQDQRLQFFRDARDIGTYRLASASLNVGGPILRDRLWFFVSGEGINNVFTLPNDPVFGPHPSRAVNGLNTFGKLTWQVSSRNKLELKLSYSPGAFENLLQSYLVEAEAEARQWQETRFAGVQWYSTLTNDLLLNFKVNFQEMFFDIGPMLCESDPDNCLDIPSQVDLATGIRRQNYSSVTKDVRRHIEAAGHFEWYKNTKAFGNHTVRMGWKLRGLQNPSARTVTGNQVLGSVGTRPLRRSEYCSNDPRNDQGNCHYDWFYSEVGGQSVMVFAQDTFKPTRYITITPGLAFHRAHSSDDREQAVTDLTAVTPHLAAIWDATHDGKTALKGSINSGVDTGFLSLARFTGRQHYREQCDWDPEAQAYVRNCRSFGGDSSRTVGLPCGPDGLNPDGTSCRTELRAPRLWEYTAGVEREITTGIVASGTFIYRKFVHQWEDLETNAIWNEGGSALRREGRWRTGRSEFVFDLETPDEAQRRYKTFEVALRKREGILRVHASYAWTRSEGTESADFATYFLDNPGQSHFYYGALPDDFRHDVRFLASYQLRTWLSLGAIYQYISGGPYNRYFYDQEFGDYIRFQAQRGYDSRGNLDPDDDIELRLPDLSVLSLQVRLNLRQWTGQRIDVFTDIQNVLSRRTTTSVIEQDGPFFGQSLGRLPPLNARIGLSYHF